MTPVEQTSNTEDQWSECTGTNAEQLLSLGFSRWVLYSNLGLLCQLFLATEHQHFFKIQLAVFFLVGLFISIWFSIWIIYSNKSFPLGYFLATGFYQMVFFVATGQKLQPQFMDIFHFRFNFPREFLSEIIFSQRVLPDGLVIATDQKLWVEFL